MGILVSVIIPCYNATKFVEHAVRSIMAQTYKDLEIICIDDCSVDQTISILEKLALEDTRIRIIRNPENHGLIRTLNKGIDLARGVFIARMDADDISMPLRIERQLAVFKGDPELAVVGILPDLISSDGHKIGPALEFDMRSNGSLKFSTLFNCPLIHPATMLKTTIFKQYYYSESKDVLHAEDYDLWYRMLKDNRRMVVIKERLFKYRLSKGGISRTSREEQAKNHILISANVLEEYINYSLDKRTIAVVSKNDMPVSKNELILSLKALEDIKKCYLNANLSLEKVEKREIENWVSQRIVFIIFNALWKSNFIVKLYCGIALLNYLGVVFQRNTYINMVSRINILRFKNK